MTNVHKHILSFVFDENQEVYLIQSMEKILYLSFSNLNIFSLDDEIYIDVNKKYQNFKVYEKSKTLCFGITRINENPTLNIVINNYFKKKYQDYNDEFDYNVVPDNDKVKMLHYDLCKLDEIFDFIDNSNYYNGRIRILKVIGKKKIMKKIILKHIIDNENYDIKRLTNKYFYNENKK